MTLSIGSEKQVNVWQDLIDKNFPDGVVARAYGLNLYNDVEYAGKLLVIDVDGENIPTVTVLGTELTFQIYEFPIWPGGWMVRQPKAYEPTILLYREI